MGKFGDKFLNILKLNDEYENDDYNEDYDEDYNDYEELDEVEDTKPQRKVSKFEEAKSKAVVREQPQKPKFSSKANGKVVAMRQQGGPMEVCVIKPANVEDAREITDTLLEGRAVVLNLEGLHVDVAQRIIDFTSGSCYAIDGNLQKVSSYIFIVTPKTVDISGDFQDLLSGGFDVATFKGNN
jgi:cell division inhibitor SepF